MLIKTGSASRSENKLLFIGTSRDYKMLSAAKYIWFRHFVSVEVYFGKIGTVAELALKMRTTKCTHIITTQFGLIKKLIPTISGTHTDNIGLRLILSGVPLLLHPELTHLYSTRSGKFLFEHWCKKVINENDFCLTKDKLIWDFLTPDNYEEYYKLFGTAIAIAVDIETGDSEFKLITSVSYTGLFYAGDKYFTRTVVVKVTIDTLSYAFDLIRNFNNLPAAKITQNGRYDNLYFLRFNTPLRNWLYDTYHLMHCMFPELPKDLAFISSFFISDFLYWKDESTENLYEYNAKDTHNTLWVFLAQMRYAKKYARYAFKNYIQEFVVCYPAISAELEGIAYNEEERQRLHLEHYEMQENVLTSIRELLGIPTFNPNSSKQVLEVGNALGVITKFHLESTGKVAMEKFKDAHPVYALFVSMVQEYRKHSKVLGTYLKQETFWNGRLHYSLDPAGTETGRLASRASSFWCGHNEQNIPPSVKSMYEADPGWLLFEVDKSQSESWCTGYLSQDKKLLEILHNSPDFHCSNAELFFGIPFDELYDVNTGTKLNKPIRDLSKRTNHGANYNMGANVLVDTMGEKNIRQAGRLLNLPLHLTSKAIALYLLECFDNAYPTIRDTKTGYYARIIKEVLTTGCLKGPTGWTRRTFLQPTKNKLDLNTITAHPSQSLSVLLVNKAWVKILFELQLGKYYNKLRVKAQNHDSILGQVRIGHEYIVEEIERYMRVPVKVHGKILEIPGDCGPVGKTWLSIKD